MKKRKVPKKSKRRLIIFGTLSLFIIGYTIFTICYYSYNITKVCKENQKLEQQLSTLQNTEENLRLEIQKLKDPEYVARYARENYSYSKDGEYIIKIDEKGQKEIQIEEKPNYLFYGILVSGILLLIMLVFIIIKIIKNKTVEE